MFHSLKIILGKIKLIFYIKNKKSNKNIFLFGTAFSNGWLSMKFPTGFVYYWSTKIKSNKMIKLTSYIINKKSQHHQPKASDISPSFKTLNQPKIIISKWYLSFLTSKGNDLDKRKQANMWFFFNLGLS